MTSYKLKSVFYLGFQHKGSIKILGGVFYCGLNIDVHMTPIHFNSLEWVYVLILLNAHMLCSESEFSVYIHVSSNSESCSDSSLAI